MDRNVSSLHLACTYHRIPSCFGASFGCFRPFLPPLICLVAKGLFLEGKGRDAHFSIVLAGIFFIFAPSRMPDSQKLEGNTKVRRGAGSMPGSRCAE